MDRGITGRREDFGTALIFLERIAYRLKAIHLDDVVARTPDVDCLQAPKKTE
jgi:hypothetical protein